jgi:hypothetical protein
MKSSLLLFLICIESLITGIQENRKLYKSGFDLTDNVRLSRDFCS